MPPDTQVDPLAPKSLRDLSGSLSLAALAMLTVFILAMVSSLLPARLGDPAWQLGMVAALVDNAVIPLVALMTLHIAARLNQRDAFSASLRDTAARWAILAAIGFLLLAPLQLWNSWRLQQSDAQLFARQERQSQQRFQALRRAVTEASSTVALQSELQRLVGPGLERLDPATPLPQLRQQLSTILERNQSLLRQQITRQRQQRSEARNGGGLLPAPVRGALSCLAYALGFAALARRSGSEVSLLAAVLFRALRHEERIGANTDEPPLRDEDLVP